MKFDAKRKHERTPLAYISKKGLVIKDPYDDEAAMAIDLDGRQSYVDFDIEDALNENYIFYKGDVIKITL